MKKNEFSIPSKEIEVPGDKSLSHRFVIFASMAKGVSISTGFLEAEDPLHTMKCFQSLGVRFEKISQGSYRVESPGVAGLKSPLEELDFGNGGTGIRLSCGFLSGLPGMEAVLTGDASLRKRPMDRIIKPLNSLGANVTSIPEDGRAPLRVVGQKLTKGKYSSPISSAQVKSCLMFAAMASQVGLDYEEPEISRNHTENMMQFLGGKINYQSSTRFVMEPPYDFKGAEFHIPGDISSAAFFIVLGLLGREDSVLRINKIGLNPSRIGILEVLKNMNARIEITNKRKECGEEIGDIIVRGSHLKKWEIPASLIPSIIDEIPILTILGMFSEGGFCIRNAEELRAKESDRIHSMVVNLKKLGVPVVEYEDGYEFEEIPGELQENVQIETFMDHRIAMSFSILAYASGIKINIDDTSWVETSFPGFFEILDGISK
ncbi:MAG: 3-phosphoshikimate 1-carboxyvinyltransferase [Leptospira sp.]|nr:3-phosphoshikimate 1-carboxyvinyltransferase [Leptospira sp.]